MKKQYRQVLTERMVELGERASNSDLPEKPICIGLFGSFCRGKERPKDVDYL